MLKMTTWWIGELKEAYICYFPAASTPELGSKPFDAPLIVPYWLVRTTSDRAFANMHFVPLPVALSIFNAGMEDRLNAVTIPILQNYKVVNAGDELLVFDGELDEEIRETMQPSAKKQRTESAQEISDETTNDIEPEPIG